MLCRHVAWAGQGSYMPANLTGTVEATLAADAPALIWDSHWRSLQEKCLAPLGLTPLLPLSSRIRAVSARGCAGSVLLAGSLVARNGHLVCLNPHGQDICGPKKLGSMESGHQGKATHGSVPTKWWSIPDMVQLASALATEAS